MSESERDTHPAGEIATRRPKGGAATPRADANGAAGEETASADRNGAAPRQTAARVDEAPGHAPVIPLERPSMLHEEPSAPRNVRIRKLRVFGVLLGLGILAVISTLFGMMMAVTSDLPSLELHVGGRNSVLQ